jgi:hypothetical protein
MVMAGTKVATLDQLLSTRVRTVYPYRVNFDGITRDQIQEMDSWCTDNCKEIWREEHHYAHYFQFTDEHDAMMFMLKFGSRGNR